jgi:predicted RNA-binding protein Jag
LEKTLDDLGVTSEQITMKYEGNKEGDLTSLQKHEIAELLVKELQGEIALEYDEGDLYTIYAYTGMLNDYVTSMGNKINVQIAITYNELTNKTKIALATPINNESW